jgi:hypothetical protein
MPGVESGLVTAFYLFDVAEAIDLKAVPRLLPAQTSAARLAPKPVTPSHVQYQNPPPLLVDGEALPHAEVDGFRVRMKLFEYGVVSLALSRPFSGPWPALVSAGQQIVGSDGLEKHAQRLCVSIAERLRPALDSPRKRFLSEDYVVFAISGLAERLTAEQLIEQHGNEIALLLSGEREALSRQEREEVLRHRISYLADDLVVPTWNAAFVYDTEAGTQAALEIFEFANSQLLEFRYYDDLLDDELRRIYDDLQRPRWTDVFGRRYMRAANELHTLFIDVNELTDKTENALKMVGDLYAARLYNLVAARLALRQWKQSVAEKLKTLHDIYHFSVEQTQMARGHFLELTIIAILVLELVLFFVGIMK